MNKQLFDKITPSKSGPNYFPWYTLKYIYLVPVHPHSLCCCLTQFLPVQLCSPAVILLLGVGGQAVVAAEEGACLGISS